jgi:hypothetical protein
VIAAQQKEDLRLKGVALTISIKIGEKGILLEDLQKDFGVKYGLKQAGKGRLADSDDPFDGNIRKAPVVRLIKILQPFDFAQGVKCQGEVSCVREKKIVWLLRDDSSQSKKKECLSVG